MLDSIGPVGAKALRAKRLRVKAAAPFLSLVPVAILTLPVPVAADVEICVWTARTEVKGVWADEVDHGSLAHGEGFDSEAN